MWKSAGSWLKHLIMAQRTAMLAESCERNSNGCVPYLAILAKASAKPVNVQSVGGWLQ